MQVRAWKKNAKKDQEAVTALLEIVDSFIVEGSKKEVNVTGEIKRAILKTVDTAGQREKSSELLVPHSVFDEALAVVLRELNEDAFCRFIRSEYLSEYIKSCKDDTFLMSIGIKKEEKLDKIKLEYEDFFNHEITDTDIKKMFNIVEDSSDGFMKD